MLRRFSFNLLRASSATLTSAVVRRTMVQSAGLQGLARIAKVDILRQNSPQEIRQIWKQFHEDKPNRAATSMSSLASSTIIERAKDCPIYLLPLRQASGGATLVYSQFRDNSFAMTFLEDFKNSPQAPLLLSVTHYNELSEEKNVVLVRVEFDDGKISKEAAIGLMNTLHTSYGNDDEFRWVHSMNKTPDQFKMDEFIQRLSANNNNTTSQ